MNALAALVSLPLVVGAVALTIGAYILSKRAGWIAPAILLVFAFLQAAAYVAVVVVFTRVELSVTNGQIAWAFGAGAFRETASRSELLSASAKVEIPHGLGLRIEKDYIAYWLGGTRGVRMRFTSGAEYEVSCPDPAPVLKALATVHE